MYLYVKCINCAFSTIILLNFGTVSIVWYLIGLQDEFEDTKGVIRIRKLKKDSNTMPQKQGQRSNSNLQNTTQNTKDRATRTLLKTEG